MVIWDCFSCNHENELGLRELLIAQLNELEETGWEVFSVHVFADQLRGRAMVVVRRSTEQEKKPEPAEHPRYLADPPCPTCRKPVLGHNDQEWEACRGRPKSDGLGAGARITEESCSGPELEKRTARMVEELRAEQATKAFGYYDAGPWTSEKVLAMPDINRPSCAEMVAIMDRDAMLCLVCKRSLWDHAHSSLQACFLNRKATK